MSSKTLTRKTSTAWLSKKAKSYDSLNDTQKHKFISEAYHAHGLSYGKIGELCDKHANTVRRDAIRLGVKRRNKSEAQALALESGRHKHPTRGQQRSEEVKERISESVSADWDKMSEVEREARRQLGRERWAAMSEVEKSNFQRKAGDAIRLAAKHGSKLEKFIFQELVSNSYAVRFHQDKFVKKETLQLDLFLPILNVAIEVDGPSHFLPIWGEEALARNRRADANKDGLLLAAGICVIRVQQRKALSAKYKRTISKALLGHLEKISKKFPSRDNRHIVIGA